MWWWSFVAHFSTANHREWSYRPPSKSNQEAHKPLDRMAELDLDRFRCLWAYNALLLEVARELHCEKSEKLTTRIFIGTIGTVFFAVTEETTFNAIAITASQKAILTQWLIGDEQWLHFTLFVLQLAILYRLLPVARLLLNIEKQSSWTTDRLKSLFVLEGVDVKV